MTDVPVDESNSAGSLRRVLVTRDMSRVVLALFVAAFLLRTLGPIWRGGLSPEFPDSYSFLDAARSGPWWPSFWFGDRPAGLPLVTWLLGRNVSAIVLAQTIGYALAIAVLGATILRTVGNRIVGWFAVAAIVSLAVQPRFALWSLEVLSESLGSTLALSTLAAWIVHARSSERRHYVVAITSTLVWLLTRDAHAVTVAAIASVLLVTSWRAGDDSRRRQLRIGAAALVLGVVYVGVAQGVSERNRYPLVNNVGLRVLTDPGLTEDWVGRGMPMSDALLERRGSDSWSDGEAFLRDPRLQDFRAWVDGEGQRDQVASLVLDAPHWLGEFRRALPSLVSYSFADYDNHQLADRLPDHALGIDLPTTNSGLAVWLGLGAVAIAVIARRRRTLALVLGTALATTIIEAYCSFVLDAVEVQRHMVGVMLRFAVIVVIALAVAIGDLVPRRVRDLPHVPRSTAATVGGLVALVGAAWIAIEFRAQDYDPQFARTVVERAARFGGTYYENGIHNKGPFEMVVYDAARLFTSYDSYWFVIAAFVVLIAAVVGLAAASLSLAVDSRRAVAAAVGLAAFTHLTVSSSDYAGVLYSRNITTGLFAFAVVIAMSERFWRTSRRANIAWIAISVIVGLAVQTLLTSLFAATGIVLLVVVTRRRATSLRRPSIVFAAGVVSTVATAPVWYAIRGSFAEFWSGWWTYASFMNSGLGRGLRDQFGLGWQTFLGYHQDRPMLVVLYTVFGVTAWTRRRTLSPVQRAVAIALAMWWVGGWIELILSQRYSSHYFSVIAVPTLLMLAFVIGLVMPRDLSSTTRRLLPALGVLTIVVFQGTDLFWAGAESAGRFTGFSAHATERDRARSGEARTVHAVLDLVSRDGDSLLAWTMYPWTYLENHRVPATRFAWKSFLIGEVYLGRTSPDYVLARTDEWLADDLDEAHPRAYVHPISVSTGGIDVLQKYVDRDFEPVMTTEQTEVWIASDAWSALRAAPRTAADDVAVTNVPTIVADDDCRAIGATLTRSDPDNGVSFWFRDADGSTETVALSLSRDRAWSSSEAVEFGSTPLDSRESVDILLLVGSRSAALVVDGRIVAAVEIDGDTTVTAVDRSGSVTLTNVRTGPMPSIAGC